MTVNFFCGQFLSKNERENFLWAIFRKKIFSEQTLREKRERNLFWVTCQHKTCKKFFLVIAKRKIDHLFRFSRWRRFKKV